MNQLTAPLSPNEQAALSLILRKIQAAENREFIPKSLLAYQKLRREAAKLFDVAEDDIQGSERWRPLPQARWWIWVRMRDQGFSLPRIGRFAGRDHTSVMYGIEQAENGRAEP